MEKGCVECNGSNGVNLYVYKYICSVNIHLTQQNTKNIIRRENLNI